jgi:hypothetical protein
MYTVPLGAAPPRRGPALSEAHGAEKPTLAAPGGVSVQAPRHAAARHDVLRPPRGLLAAWGVTPRGRGWEPRAPPPAPHPTTRDEMGSLLFGCTPGPEPAARARAVEWQGAHAAARPRTSLSLHQSVSFAEAPPSSGAAPGDAGWEEEVEERVPLGRSVNRLRPARRGRPRAEVAHEAALYAAAAAKAAAAAARVNATGGARTAVRAAARQAAPPTVPVAFAIAPPTPPGGRRGPLPLARGHENAAFFRRMLPAADTSAPTPPAGEQEEKEVGYESAEASYPPAAVDAWAAVRDDESSFAAAVAAEADEAAAADLDTEFLLMAAEEVEVAAAAVTALRDAVLSEAAAVLYARESMEALEASLAAEAVELQGQGEGEEAWGPWPALPSTTVSQSSHKEPAAAGLSSAALDRDASSAKRHLEPPPVPDRGSGLRRLAPPPAAHVAISDSSPVPPAAAPGWVPSADAAAAARSAAREATATFEWSSEVRAATVPSRSRVEVRSHARASEASLRASGGEMRGEAPDEFIYVPRPLIVSAAAAGWKRPQVRGSSAWGGAEFDAAAWAHGERSSEDVRSPVASARASGGQHAPPLVDASRVPAGGGLPPYLMGVRSRIGESVRAARREYQASLVAGGAAAPMWAVPCEGPSADGSPPAAAGEESEGSGSEAALASPTTVREIMGEALYEAGLAAEAAEEEEGGPSTGPVLQEVICPSSSLDPAEVTLS